ncbi:MAG: hypothetical protein PHT33_10240, partial [bacterium]|nr:hypothetical protein [bacterium]
VGALGHQDRYRLINGFADNGHRMSIWSDGGIVSYTLCANSSACAIEGGEQYIYLTGPGEALEVGRNLLGEKPMVVLNVPGDDWIGRYFKPEEFTPESLRDYYRYSSAQLMLFSVKNGIYPDPSYLCGRQWMVENNPILVESLVTGRKIVTAAAVKEPLWIRRAGEGMSSFLVAGNEKPVSIDTDITLTNRYYGEGAPVFVKYYGSETSQKTGPDKSVITGMTVGARSMEAFKLVVYLHGMGEVRVKATLQGDGIGMKGTLEINGKSAGMLEVNSFAPIYEIKGVKVNGNPAALSDNGRINLGSGRSLVEVEYGNKAFTFNGADWDKVELVKDNKANFCLIADKGVNFVRKGTSYLETITVKDIFPLGFEHGTAMMLNEFLDQYDEEDGIIGNLGTAAIADKAPEGYQGWKVYVRSDRILGEGRVRIDAAGRSLYIEGATPGEARRAMVVFMRLVDRRYPRISRLIPLRDKTALYSKNEKHPWDRWIDNKDTKEFFKNFSDPQWLIKPILEPEYDALYAGGNMDFQGKYKLKFSPYIFEPTYGDGFVYGYQGNPGAESEEELNRKAMGKSN